MDDKVERDEREKKEAAEIEKAIKESIDMQEQVRRKTKLVVNKDTWDAKWGCPKCSWAKKGSTCCNPHKRIAKMDAEKLYGQKHGIPAKDGNYDPEVYNELYAKIRDKIMEELSVRKLCVFTKIWWWWRWMVDFLLENYVFS